MEAQGHAGRRGRRKSRRRIICRAAMCSTRLDRLARRPSDETLPAAGGLLSVVPVTCGGERTESVAFCCISTGEFHFRTRSSGRLRATVKEFLAQKETSVEKVIFNVFRTATGRFMRLLGEK